MAAGRTRRPSIVSAVEVRCGSEHDSGHQAEVQDRSCGDPHGRGALDLHGPPPVSAARLPAWGPWLCVPASRRVCHCRVDRHRGRCWPTATG